MGPVPDNVSLHGLMHSQVLEGSCPLLEVASMLLPWDKELSLSQSHGML